MVMYLGDETETAGSAWCIESKIDTCEPRTDFIRNRQSVKQAATIEQAVRDVELFGLAETRPCLLPRLRFERVGGVVSLRTPAEDSSRLCRISLLRPDQRRSRIDCKTFHLSV
jgi:hypothetical protein